ncbi:hypothetical protein BOO86_15720 [Mycobacterium sp. CBMA 234]|uniref:hypothetical protein n=1 Tax=Mycolicibacterium sp. CBMA 234 TaxID=1918495 RepID=UPI0012DF8CD2|nr:hypothetical protein [Mycolicibacterium sp. CBMA 234]MUL65924.1 hypothetical protein [Mycolicibacterium sp. CBMA 234]
MLDERPFTLGMMAPPLDTPTPATAQLVVTAITGTLVLGALTYALMYWRRRGTPLYLFILLGGALAVLNEPALDLVSQIWFPRGGWTVFEAYGRPMPVWALLSYTTFFGTQTFAVLELLKRGITRSRFWMGMAGVWLFNIALEVPVLRTELYFYFGYQPLRILDFPAVWLVLNSIGVALAVVIFQRFGDFFTGRRMLLAATVPPICQLVGLWFGTAHFVLLNTDASTLAKTVGTAVSIIAGLIALDGLARLICRFTPQAPSGSSQIRIPAMKG